MHNASMARLPSVVEITRRVRIPSSEIELSYARSGGPGGQHVNKTSSKVILRWSVRESAALSDEDRALLEEKLASRLTESGELLLSSNTHREQGRNLDEVVARFGAIVREALRREKKRKKTRPSKRARQRRLDEKKRQSQRKRDRRTLE